MENSNVLTEQEKQQRLNIVAMLLPHFGKSIGQLLVAATLVQEHIEGPRHSLPSGTERKG